MSTIFSAKQIAEWALRHVGAFAINDAAAEPEHLKVALESLDLNMAELAGTGRRFWLLSSTLSVPLDVASQPTYELKDQVGTDWPDDGMVFPVETWLEDGNGNRQRFDLVTRHDFENRSRPLQSGTPCIGWIDRLHETDASPTLSIHPVPTDTTWIVKLIVQQFANDVANQKGKEVAHGLRRTWQRWAIYQVASDIGNGPIRRLPAPTISGFRTIAKEAKEALEAFEDREHETTPPIVDMGWPDDSSRGYDDYGNWPGRWLV